MSNVHQRENTEPTEQDHAIPLAMWVVVGILTVWGIGFYVMSLEDAPAAQSTGNDSRVAKQAVPLSVKAESKAVAVAPSVGHSNTTHADNAGHSTNTAVGDELAALDGGSIYASQCQACHQAGGIGMAGVFPPLKEAEWVKGDPRVLAGIILAGYTGSLDVLGQTYNGAMPAFGDQLNDAEAAALINYLRTTLNDEAAVDTHLVASVRRQIPDGPYTNTADLGALVQP